MALTELKRTGKITKIDMLLGKNKSDKKQDILPNNFVPVTPGAEETVEKQNLPQTDRPRNAKRYIALLFVLFIIILIGFAAVLVIGTPAQREARRVEAEKTASAELDLANKAVGLKNTSLALQHAERALEASPKHMHALLTTASLVEKSDPEKANQLYARALKVYEEHNISGVKKPHVNAYYAAAGLAEDAGDNEKALEYYRKVIAEADGADSFESNLKRQSYISVERLKK